MERLEKGGKLDLTVDIFKRYHRGLVANHIIDVPNNKLHSDFVSGHRLSLSAQSFREIFIQTTLKNRIYQNNPNKLWDAFKNKKLSISKNFGSGDETSPFPTNSAIDASEIDAFFKQFTLAVNQPNENQLRTVLAREIGHQIQFNLLDSELAADHIQRQMLDWFKERGGKFLSAQDGKQYFAQASARINTLLSTGSSIEQAAKLANYGIHFSQDAITALQNSIQTNPRVLHLMTAETRLEAIKVYQSLQTLPEYQQRDSVLFTELRTLSLKKLRQQLFKAFNADKSHPLLVIECSSETINGDITEIVGQLTSILESPSQKKLIIIAPQTHPLAEAFNEHPTLSYHSVVEAPTFSELAAKTQQALLDKEVLFQGHRVTLQQLLPSDFPRDTLPLMNLIQSSEEKPLPIGAALPPTPSEVGGYYLERLVTPPLIKYSITQALPADFTDLLAFNEQSFNTMCQDHPRKAVHWLQRMQHNALLLWRQSRGDTTALQPYVEDSPHAIAIAQKALASADFSTLSQLESHRVVLLSAPAGMGKSTFLTHTAQQLKRQQPDHWVIRIDLNQQTEALQHLQHPTVTAAAEWVVEAAQLHNSFEQPLLRQALQLPRSAKVRILLDGFDEISPTHQTSALKLLEGLREQQIWVTTRPHWEERLAQHCQTLPFSLKPLSDSEQQRFLTDYCRAQHQLEPTQVTAVEKSAEALLNHLVRSDISTENPLQLQMLAELFSDNFKTRQSFPETELKRFSRLELYEQFVKTKYKIFRHKGSEAGAQIDKVTKSSIDVENNHQRLAVTLLFPEQQQWLLTALSLNKIKLLSPEALARYGMVTGVKNAPQFIHRTYAEYFIAELLWERVIENPKTSPAVADFLLCEVLSQKAQQGVNAFLEGWLAREGQALDPSRYTFYGERIYQLQVVQQSQYPTTVPENTLLQAVHNGHRQVIDFLCNSLNAAQQTETLRKLLTCWDASLNNLLHLAIEPGHIETVTTLLHGMEVVYTSSLDSILVHENQQQQTPFHLAVEEDQAEITRKLLQWSFEKLSAEKFQDLLFHKNGEGQTLLRVAILEEHAEITTDLLAWYDRAEIGVERVIKECFLKQNDYGQTLYQLSREQHSGKTFEIPLRWVMQKLEDQQVQKNPNKPPYRYPDDKNPKLAMQLAHQDMQDQRLVQTFFDSFLLEGNKKLLCKVWERKRYPHTQLFRAILEDDHAAIDQFRGEALKTILSEPEPLFKLNALHLAAWQGSEEVLSQLLHPTQPFGDSNQRRQGLRQCDWLQQNPLHLAILHNREGVTQQLLDAGRSLGILVELLFTRDWYGHTPLVVAIMRDKINLVQQIVKVAQQCMSLEQQGRLLTHTPRTGTLLQLAVDYNPALLSPLLGLMEPLPSSTVKALLLTPNANGRTLLSHLLANHYYVETRVIDQILQLSSQALTPSEQQAMLQPVVESPSVVQRAELDFVQRLRQRLTQVISEPTESRSVSLTGLRTLLQSQQIHWRSLSDCAAGSSRTRRAASGCIETQTERELAYQPLEDSASYLPEQIQAAHQHSLFTLMVAWRRENPQPVEVLMDYQRAVGAILSEGEANHSPREADILRTHYQQAQQFHAQFSQETLFQKITKLPEGTPGKRQSWLYKQGRYTVSLLWDGNRYALYSPDFNYQQLLYAPSEVTKAQIESWVNAFLQWRTGEASYTLWTLPETLPRAALQELNQAPFWKPQLALPDSILLKQSGSQIDGIPLKALQALIRLDRKPVAYEALHADFLRLHHKNIRLHVESLHQVLLTLNADEQQALNAVVRKYGWPVDNSDLHGLPEEEQRSLVRYHKLVMESFKDERVLLTPHRLSKLSWDALQQEFAEVFNELPATVRKPLAQAMWREIQPKLQRAWSMGQRGGEQTLFFLPDLIRFANSGDPGPLIQISAIMAGDHGLTRLLGRLRTSVVNNVHKNALLILKRISAVSSLSIHATNLAKMLQRIPVLSPIFTGLTIYSIVKLSQQLSTLPPNSVERQVVASELFLQSTTLALIVVSPLLGAASGPLWLAFTALSLWVSAENLKQAEQLNVSFWKALGFSLGFHQDELRAIYQGRELAQITLDYAERLATALNSTIGWTIVKVPSLNTGEWRNISINKVPESIQQTINHQASEEPFPHVGSHQYIEAGSFRRLNIFRVKNTLVSSSAPEQSGWKLVRDDLLETYWHQRFYHATPVATTMNFTAACGSWERGNSFLSSFPAPWGNYTLEDTVYEPLDPIKAKEIVTKEEALYEQRCVKPMACGLPIGEPWNLPSVKIDKPWFTPAKSIALYADKRTFSNPTAQRALYFFFDPREGDSRLVIGADGLQIWDQMNQNHNPNYSPALNTQEYLIVVQVGHKAYSDAILFPPRARSQLSVADKTHRIASRYLIQSDYTVPFEVIDEAAHVEMVFLPSSTVKTTLNSLFLNHQDFQIILSAAEQTFNFTLLGNKTYLRLILTSQQAITHLKLSAQHVEIVHAQGVNNNSRLELDCRVETFMLTIHGDLTVNSCGDTLSWQGKRADNAADIRYTKLSNFMTATLYQLQLPPEISAFPSLLQTLKRQLIDDSTRVSTTFFTLGLSGCWLTPWNSSPLKQLRILGQLDQRNATLTLEETQSTLIGFTETWQPAFTVVEHYSTQANLATSLRLQGAESSLSTLKGQNPSIQLGLAYLATLSCETQGTVLLLESPQGHLEIHRFPNNEGQCITLNGIDYQVGPGSRLYAVGATEGRISGNHLLYDTDQRPVAIAFPMGLNASQLASVHGGVSVNGLQLEQLPKQTRLYFGNLSSPDIIPLHALQDTLLLPAKLPEVLSSEPPHHHRHHHQRR
ncbi:MAG: ankyrin repeat domain-containing protein [Candidatus Symbiodolus clandestinus]